MAQRVEAGDAAEFWSEVARRNARTSRPIVDADAHLQESLRDIAPFVDGPWRRQVEVLTGPEEFYALPFDLGDETVGGRIKRRRGASAAESVELARDAMGIDCAVVFPTSLLGLGLHPDHALEAAIANGYARWLTEAVLPEHPGLRAVLYLPFNDAEASLALVRRFAGRRGVAGFVVTSVRHQMVHENRYMAVYEAIEAADLPLAFHPSPFWRNKQFEVFNQFLSALTVSLPLYNLVHLLNLVLHGVPERFPRLRLLFCEAGVAWLPFAMYRVDMEYMKRPSEAPLLRRKPSEYLRDVYFTTHPLEVMDPARLRGLLRLVDARRHLLFASNAPSWDFDLPSRIVDLGLEPEEEAAILSTNAARLFRVELPAASKGRV